MHGDWKVAQDPDTGKSYYWNVETQETRWDPPTPPPLPPIPTAPKPTRSENVSLLYVGAGDLPLPKLSVVRRTVQIRGRAVPYWAIATAAVALLTLITVVSVVASVGNQGSISAPVHSGIMKIAAFNIQIFGTSKMSLPQVPEILSRIIQRYDIVLIQEIRDLSGTAIQQLLELVNTGPEEYAVVISPRLGRTSSKEQYAYMYRKKILASIDTFVFDDAAYDDLYQREPYIAQFRSIANPTCEFVLIGVHTDPDEAPQEISNLTTVFYAACRHYGQKEAPAIIMGDFNAGCTYVRKSEWPHVALRWDKRFTWVIGNDVDTTTSGTHCPYDRFVISSTLLPRYVSNSANVFLFDVAYDLSATLTSQVSDHYPIEMELSCKI